MNMRIALFQVTQPSIVTLGLTGCNVIGKDVLLVLVEGTKGLLQLGIES